MTADQPPEPPLPAAAAPAPQTKSARATRYYPAPPHRPWLLLDPFTARHARSIAFGLLDARLLSRSAASPGYSLAFGENLTTVTSYFAAGALQEHELRLVPDDALVVNLSRYQWEGSLRLGVLEPTVRVGFTTLHLDVGDAGFSFGAFSPRVGAGLWLALPSARLGVSVFSEYFWRWWGEESALVRGLTFEIQPRAEPLRKPRPRVPERPLR